MSKYKDFDAALAEREPTEPIEFSLGGQRWQVTMPLPAGAVFKWVTEGAAAAPVKYIAVCTDFIAAVVDYSPDPDHQGRIDAAEAVLGAIRGGDDEDAIAHAEKLLTEAREATPRTSAQRMREAIMSWRGSHDDLDDICRWLVQGGTEAPLPGSEPSPSEPQTTGDGSKDDSHSEVSTSSTSERDGP